MQSQAPIVLVPVVPQVGEEFHVPARTMVASDCAAVRPGVGRDASKIAFPTTPWFTLSSQEGCCLAFSVGLPLLGKRHRKHVHRCFSLAAQILQELESPLARLRAQLHLEVSETGETGPRRAQVSHVSEACA